MSGLRARNFDLLRTGHVALQRRSSRAARSRLGRSCAPISLATRNSQPATRTAFTLIEVLIVITIIATLSAAFLGVSGAAMESSREARTKTTIGKLNALLMEKWASYSTRRVDVKQSVLDSINSISNPKVRGVRLARARLDATYELMKFEMPDRWSDILGESVGDALPGTPDANFDKLASRYVAVRPGLANLYLRRYRALNASDSNKITQNQSAECLYLVIMLSTGDGEARTLFSDKNIGDTDGDGALEFLDGWGRPIQWIRWPVGFVSDLMPLDPNEIASSTAPLLEARYYKIDHDPFDPFRLEQMAFRITPLIYSAGSDGQFDISFVQAAFAQKLFAGINTKTMPYHHARDVNGVDLKDGSGNLLYIGKQRDNPNELDGEDNSIDNIHNHLLGN